MQQKYDRLAYVFLYDVILSGRIRSRQKSRHVLQTSLQLYPYAGTTVRRLQDPQIRFAVDKTLRTKRFNRLCHTVEPFVNVLEPDQMRGKP